MGGRKKMQQSRKVAVCNRLGEISACFYAVGKETIES